MAGIPVAVLVFGAMIMSFFFLGAHYLSFPRLMMHGIFFGLALPLSFYLVAIYNWKDSFIWIHGTPGTIMVVLGTILLYRFLQQNRPLQSEGEDNDSRS